MIQVTDQRNETIAKQVTAIPQLIFISAITERFQPSWIAATRIDYLNIAFVKNINLFKYIFSQPVFYYNFSFFLKNYLIYDQI